MKGELLSICIPTRNRERYLRELLTSFELQFRAHPPSSNEVAFYISDNAAEDQTPEVVRQFKERVGVPVNYSRNATNLGGDRNNLLVRTLACGSYLWVIVDDDVLADNAVAGVLGLIKEHAPGLILAYSSKYDLRIPVPQVFADYKMFARESIRHNVHALAEHSLVSCNIFRRDCYDPAYAEEMVKTRFPHMFGMVRPLLKNQAKVVVPALPILSVREQSPGAVDGDWEDLDALWIGYFKWLQEELQMPELDPYAPSEHARRSLQGRLLRNPLRVVWNNRQALFDPRAYMFLYARLFRKRR